MERGQRAKRPRVTPHLGVDEKAIAKGHQYLTLVCDLDRATVEYLAEDRKQASLAGYFTGLAADQLAGIEAIALDMREPYVQAIRAHVPGAESKMVFDRYHIMTHMGQAVDNVRNANIAPWPRPEMSRSAARRPPALRRGESAGAAPGAVRPAQSPDAQDGPRLGAQGELARVGSTPARLGRAPLEAVVLLVDPLAPDARDRHRGQSSATCPTS